MMPFCVNFLIPQPHLFPNIFIEPCFFSFNMMNKKKKNKMLIKSLNLQHQNMKCNLFITITQQTLVFFLMSAKHSVFVTWGHSYRVMTLLLEPIKKKKKRKEERFLFHGSGTKGNIERKINTAVLTVHPVAAKCK